MLFKKKPQIKSTDFRSIIGKVKISGKKRPKKSIFIVVGVLLITVIGIALLYQYSSKKTPTVKVVTNAMLQESVPYLNGSDQGKLKVIADKILSSPNFEKESNALYIVTTYYIFAGDTVNARKYFDILSLIYKSDQPSIVLVQEGGDLAALKVRIEVFEAQLKQNRSNFMGFGDKEQ